MISDIFFLTNIVLITIIGDMYLLMIMKPCII